MSTQPMQVTRWARTGLVVLCLLLAASVALRIYAYRLHSDGGPRGWEALGAPVDLGEDILLPRTAARPLQVQVEHCASPVSIDFFRTSPYEPDPSLIGSPRPDDRVFYVYHGWNLGFRFAAVSLNAIYFARQAYARVTMRWKPAWDDIAVKLIVPARCDASPDDVLAVLRQAARFQR